jgi:hypothetical protein
MTATKTRAFIVNGGGQRETERLLLEAEGISFMVNDDGTIVIELYRADPRANRLLIRICPEDSAAQGPALRDWERLRSNAKR